jgi:hypothetical protein
MNVYFFSFVKVQSVNILTYYFCLRKVFTPYFLQNKTHHDMFVYIKHTNRNLHTSLHFSGSRALVDCAIHFRILKD